MGANAIRPVALGMGWVGQGMVSTGLHWPHPARTPPGAPFGKAKVASESL